MPRCEMSHLAAHRPHAIRTNVGIVCTVGPRPIVDLLDKYCSDHPDIELADVPECEHQSFIVSLLDETKGNLWPLAIDS